MTTSLEMLMENTRKPLEYNDQEIQQIIQAFNIILTQQKLHQTVEDVCILVTSGDDIIAIDDGKTLYSHFFGNTSTLDGADSSAKL